MTCLYLHGYNSSLSAEKRTILKKHYTIVAPTINYDEDNINAVIEKAIAEQKINVIIGSSLGGYIGYYLAENFNIPCLLFNPAFASERTNEINFIKPETTYTKQAVTYIVLGKRDDVLDFQKTVSCIDGEIYDLKCYIKIHPSLQHQIPVNVFENEINNFFKINRLN
jgi:predicted esterase YcpF (UPF0227 family)